ncbi:Netrin receptor UNC5B-a [Nymphon striatum]|nr:Netrin receptor UNC5B-a [Nymphon striatum]
MAGGLPGPRGQPAVQIVSITREGPVPTRSQATEASTAQVVIWPPEIAPEACVEGHQDVKLLAKMDQMVSGLLATPSSCSIIILKSHPKPIFVFNSSIRSRRWAQSRLVHGHILCNHSVCSHIDYNRSGDGEEERKRSDYIHPSLVRHQVILFFSTEMRRYYTNVNPDMQLEDTHVISSDMAFSEKGSGIRKECPSPLYSVPYETIENETHTLNSPLIQNMSASSREKVQAQESATSEDCSTASTHYESQPVSEYDSDSGLGNRTNSSNKKVNLFSKSKSMDKYGGKIHVASSGVSLTVPYNAVCKSAMRLTVSVLTSDQTRPALSANETLVSPMVSIGPGTSSLSKPVILSIPHCADMINGKWKFSIYQDTNDETLSPPQWEEIPFCHIWSGSQNNLHCSFSMEQSEASVNRLECNILIHQEEDTQSTVRLAVQTDVDKDMHIYKEIEPTTPVIYDNPPNFVQKENLKLYHKTRKHLCAALDQPNSKGNDWRLLAKHLQADRYINYFATKLSPTEHILDLWEARNTEESALNDLINFLRLMGRNDIVHYLEAPQISPTSVRPA